MKTIRLRPNTTLLLLSAAMLLSLMNASAESESPVQGSVASVGGGPTSSSVNAEIIPLFWKARIGKSIVSVPLQSIEYFGVQSYVVDGTARVRELTISTHSQSMVRIYHMQPLTAAARIAANAVDRIGRSSDDEIEVPVKVFPTTTHVHMVEYRTSKREDIDTLYQHLEAAMKDYHARALVAAQRGDTVREVKVSQPE
jgi:hypothetical protein